MAVFDLDPIDPGNVDHRRDRRRAWNALLAAFFAVAVLWWVKLVETWLGWDFSGLGVYPHKFNGLIGIVTAPLVHGSFDHLIANSLPTLVLGFLSVYFYPRATPLALLLVWLVGGAGVWLFGRPSLHFGASGIGHGLLFFVFTLGLLRRERRAITAAMIAFFLYGGMLVTIFPREPEVSWEYHLFGALGGAIAAVIGRSRDPLPAKKKYSWDYEEEAERAAAAEYELPRPDDVPVLWRRDPWPEDRGQIIVFPTDRARPNGNGHEPPPDDQKPTLH